MCVELDVVGVVYEVCECCFVVVVYGYELVRFRYVIDVLYLYILVLIVFVSV